MIPIMFAEIDPFLSDLRFRLLTFGPDQNVFHLGDPVRVVHFVELGAIQLVRHQSDGSVLVLQRAGPGSIVAEASLYSRAYHCDAVALGPATTRAYAKVELQKRLKQSSEFSDAWARRLSLELQNARLHAEILSLKTVAQRLDAWMTWKDGVFPRKGEWKTIASQLGVSPEALYREIAKRRRRKPG